MIKEILINILKSSLKFIFIFIIFFVLVFFIVFLYNFFPFVKIGIKNIDIKSILDLLLFPSFFVTFYTVVVLSLFVYAILVINYQKKKRIIYYIMPLIYSAIFTLFLISFLDPNTQNTSFNSINDARVYFTEKTFFDYKDKIPVKIDKSDFEKNIISKLDDNNEKIFISKRFIFNYKDNFYYADRNIDLNDTEKVITILYKINFLEKKRFYFSKINKDSVENMILIKNNDVYTFQNVGLKFIKDKIFLYTEKESDSYEFEKLQLNEFNIYRNGFMKKIVEIFTNFSSKFFIFKNKINISIMVISVAFLILAFSSLIMIGDYPFISLIFKVILLTFFYLVFDISFNFYFRTIIDYLPKRFVIYNEIIFSSIFFIIGLFIHAIRILFFKTNIWEKD